MFSKYSKHIFLTSLSYRKKIVFSLIILIALCAIIIHIDSQLKLNVINLVPPENVSCYNEFVGDVLPRIGDSFSPPAKSIHFHETSCKGRLNTRQACALESAARTHPNWQINLFFSAPVSQESFNIGSLRALKKYQNIKYLRLNLVDYAKGTPLESMVAEGGLNLSRWRFSHTSDALRYLSLYKWGGVYLDLDVVVARSFEDLAPNWAARETDISVASGALAFSRDELGRKVAEDAIRDFRDNFRGDLWGHNGPGVITRTLQKMCSTENILEMSAEKCKGFEVYGPELFYPVNWMDAKLYFDSEELTVENPYSYHVWNKRTAGWTLRKESVYMKLAKKYCPVIYETFGDDFGL